MGRSVTPRCRTGSVIGEGGLAIVHRGQRVLANGQVHDAAFKKLRPEYRDNAVVLDRFGKEAMRAMALAHPNLVKILDYDKDEDGHPCLVMELIRGVSLEAVMARISLPFPEVRHIALSVLDALEYLHSRNLCHGDVSARNILLSDTGEIKLIDLGFAAPLDGNRSIQGFAGTPAYTNPEAIAEVAQTPSSELYSLAAVLHHVISKSPPFVSEDLHEVRRHMQADAYAPLPEDIPEDLRAVIEGALRYAPEDRKFPSATAMKQAMLDRDGPQPRATQGDIKHLVERMLHADKSLAMAELREAHKPSHCTGAMRPRRRQAWLALAGLLCLALGALGLFAVVTGLGDGEVAQQGKETGNAGAATAPLPWEEPSLPARHAPPSAYAVTEGAQDGRTLLPRQSEARQSQQTPHRLSSGRKPEQATLSGPAQHPISESWVELRRSRARRR